MGSRDIINDLIFKTKNNIAGSDLSDKFQKAITFGKWTSISTILKDIDEIKDLMFYIIGFVEDASNEYVDENGYIKLSDEKRQAAATIMDDYFSFGFPLEFFDGKIFDILIGLIVSTLNTTFGGRFSFVRIKNFLDHGGIVSTSEEMNNESEVEVSEDV